MEGKGSKRRYSAPFKSPFQNTAANKVSKTDGKSVEGQKKRLREVNLDIADLQAEGYKVEELQMHISKLHEYNEIKDVGQMILGRLATLQGVRTKDLYEQYGLNLDD